MSAQVIPAVPAPIPIEPLGGDGMGINPNATPISPIEFVGDTNAPPSTRVREGNGALAVPDTQSLLSNRAWTDSEAAAIVMADFDRAASYRATNHEPRWQEAAESYLAYNPQVQVWEGTKTPRANVQVHLVFQQVEALIPQIVDAITGNDLDFDVEAATAGTTITQCHAVRDLITYALRSLGGQHTRFLNWREVVRRQAKDGLIYGNGVNEWGWEGPYQVPQQKWETVNFPEVVSIPHPEAPWVQVQHATGRMLSRNIARQSMKTVSQFWLDPCALTDFYIDPGCRGPNVQEAEFAIRRKLMTVGELSDLRGKMDWNIPSLSDLYDLAKSKQWTQGDTTRQIMAQAHGENIQPIDDPSLDPRLAKVEVFRYFTRDHHVWMLGRQHVSRNQDNQYAAIPFSNWTYVDVSGAFYGLSIPDIVRTDQKLAKALIDGRLDEVNLILHPPFVTKRGMFRSQSASKLRPGANWEADDPQKDIQRVEMGNVTQSAFTEVQSLETRVQAKTGVTDLAVLGIASSGGNSANRTATGVSAQTNASNSRVHYLIANYEDQVVLGTLQTVWQLSREFMNPQEMMQIVGPRGQQLMLDPVSLLNSDPRFVMRTAQRMKQRASLQGGGLNTIMQYFLNPEIATLVEEQQGQTLDVEQLSELVCDTFNLRATSFFRPLTPQEQQAKQQRQQAPIQEKLAVQQARLGAMSADSRESDETKLIIAIIQGLAQAGMLHMAAGVEAPVQLEARRLDAEIAGGQMEAQPQQEGA